jgi:uncharacterized protein YceH (UPF0502 family)
VGIEALSGSSEQSTFDDIEVRVLGVLAEKEALTPDNYPLSLNALVNGCNQLSSREPVMALAEGDVANALQRLIERRFVSEVRQASARVAKYEHRMRIKWALEQDKLAALVILMLRGPQTAGEVRGRTGRLHEFATMADAEQALQFLIDKYPPLVTRLSVVPGTKEPRYAHLLSGEPAVAAASVATSSSASRADRLTMLEEEVGRLREEIAQLRAQFNEFKNQF